MDEQALARGLSEGDLDALGALVEGYRQRMVGFALRVVDSLEAAEDVVFALLEKWAEKPPKITHDSIEGFLAVSVHNAAIDWMREQTKQRGHHPRGVEAGTKPDQRKLGPLMKKAADETDEEFYALQQSALRSLRDGDREVLELHYGRLLTREEKAAEYGGTVGAYEKRVYDARARLKTGIDALRSARTPV